MEVKKKHGSIPVYIYMYHSYLACCILINYWSMKTLGTVDNQHTTSRGVFYFTNKIVPVIRCISGTIRLQDHTQHGGLQKCTYLWIV